MLAAKVLERVACLLKADDHDRRQSMESRVIESLLADWTQIRKLEEEISPGPWEDREQAFAISRALYSLNKEWEAAAEQILARSLHSDPKAPRLAELEDALGRTKARLKHTPELQDRAFEQIRQGQTIPAQELRDELNARLRARRQIPVART